MMENTSTTNTTNCREAIVDKLHGVMAAMRRERDELHRKKALAEERLRLFQEEKEALDRTCANAQMQLETLQESGNEDAIQQVLELEKEVLRLNKEVQFQHSELVTKRNKVQDMRKMYDDEHQKRAAIVHTLQEKERHSRLQLQKKTDSNLPSRGLTTQRLLQEELEHEQDFDTLWNNKVPRGMKLSADALNKEADEIHQGNERLSRVLMGYKKRVEVVVDMDH